MAETEGSRKESLSLKIWVWNGAVVVSILGGIASVAWLWRLGLAHYGADAVWLLVQAPLTICAATLAWRFAAGHEHRWVMPTRQLTRLIEEIRKGETPIEHLTQVKGPIEPLAEAVRQMFVDARRQKQAMARLEHEKKQHVDSRTQVLERKVAAWQTQAFRDALTGLGNRRLLEEQLPKLIKQCHEKDMSFCLLAIDVDHFKQVNDTQGHAVGDRLLRDIGQLIKSAVREGDWAFRLGGDEFMIALPGHDWPAGKNLARRLVSSVDQLVKPHANDAAAGAVGWDCLPGWIAADRSCADSASGG
jgi:diguanylate cyclase (GGDEF)-like protein